MEFIKELPRKPLGGSAADGSRVAGTPALGTWRGLAAEQYIQLLVPGDSFCDLLPAYFRADKFAVVLDARDLLPDLGKAGEVFLTGAQIIVRQKGAWNQPRLRVAVLRSLGQEPEMAVQVQVELRQNQEPV